MKKVKGTVVFLLLLVPFFFTYAQKPGSEITRVHGLKEVSASGSFKVVLVQGADEGFSFDGSPDEYANINWTFKRGRLTLRKSTKDTRENIQTVYVYYSRLFKVIASGNATIASQSRIETYLFTIFASGNSFVSLELKVTRLKVDLNGQARVSVKGQCTQETITTDGLSKFYGSDLYCMDAICIARSDSQIKVQVYRELRTNGSRNISYIGNPASVDGINSSIY